MPVPSAPDTSQFPPTLPPPPARSAASAGGPRGRIRSIWLVAVLVAVIISTGAWLFSGQRDRGAEVTPPPVPAVTVTETAAADPWAETSGTRPGQPVLPAGAGPANDAAASGADAGNLNNVYTGSAATSVEFARAVRDAYVTHYLDSGELSATVVARSPVTGEIYPMRCTDNGEYVTCRGGDNAVVYIS